MAQEKPKRKGKFVIISRDAGGTKVGIPFARGAQRSRHEVVLIAEGVAAPLYEDAGFRLYFKGTANYKVEPYTIDAIKVLQRIKPDVVVTTIGAPIYLEQEFGRAANALGIPLVFLLDWWGNEVLSDAQPDLALVIDETGKKLARSHLGPRPLIINVGNWAAGAAQSVVVPETVKKHIDHLKKRYGRVLFFAGGGEETSETILLLKECLKKTPGRWVIVPRFHQNYVNLPAPGGKTFGEEWKALLADLEDRVVYVEAPWGDPIAKEADVTIASHTTLLTTAVASGKRAISLVTPQALMELKIERSLEHHPLVMAKLIPEVTEPRDLTVHIRGKKPSRRMLATHLKPYSPAKALRATEKLLGLKKRR